MHPAQGHWTGTLVHALLAHSDDLGSLAGEDRPGIVHRLDKDTTGLMMVAKTDAGAGRAAGGIKIALDRPPLPHARARLHRARHRADRRAARPRSRATACGWPSRIASTRSRRSPRSACSSASRRVASTTGSRCSSASSTRAARTRFACTWPTSTTRASATRSTGAQAQGRPRPRAAVPSRVPAQLEHPVTGEQLEFLDPLPEDLASRLRQIEERSMARTEAGDEVFAAARSGASARRARQRDG